MDVDEGGLGACSDSDFCIGRGSQPSGNVQPRRRAVGRLPAVQAFGVAPCDVAVCDDCADTRYSDLASVRVAREDEVGPSAGERGDHARVGRVRDAEAQGSGSFPRRGWGDQAVPVDVGVVGSQE